MLCAACQGDNPPGSAFCGFCGRQVSQQLSSMSTARPSLTPLPVQQSWAPGAIPPQASVPNGGQHASHSSSAATRYLCAAVALSPAVRRRALDDVLEEEHRAVITTPGVDLVTVLKYALAADRRQVIRDVILLGLLCALLVFFFVLPVLCLLVLVAAWITVCVERYANTNGAARGLRPETFSPDKAPVPPRNSYAYRQLNRIAAAGATGNVSIYSRFPPFVGYGGVTKSWSFAVDVTQAKRGGYPRQFSVQQIYDRVNAGLSELDLPGMTVTDRVFVNGRDISDDRRFLPDPNKAPSTSISTEVMRQLIAAPEERARPYLTISITGWQGDLAVTIFIRFVLSRSDLFVEAAHTVVPPVRAEFKDIDVLDADMQPGEFFGLLAGGLISTIPRLLGSVPGILREFNADTRREDKRRQVKEAGDYGALLSIREAAADSGWQRYFQQLDDARYEKVIQQRIFRSMVEFLEEHDIDTSSLVARSETLINNGVMVTGRGTLTAQSLAAGANAQATAGGLGSQAANLVSRVRGEGGGGHG